MGRPKSVFIASSSKAIPLAKALANCLRGQLNSAVDVREWYESGQFPLSQTIFESLVDQARQCDFAVVLLTKDDYAEKKGEKFFTPRDNTIFELGLFAGELGIKRCFMVCNTDSDALPSDIKGFLRSDIPAGVDIESDEGVAKALEKIGPDVLRSINAQECFPHPKLPLVTIDQLRDWERGEDDDGHLVLDSSKAAVVVRSVEPVEQRNLPFCLTVLSNLRREAQYEYYYCDADVNLQPTIKLVIHVAAAEFLSTNASIKDNWPQIRKNLSRMLGNFSIHFSPKPPLQFCVHNALSENKATCYFRCNVLGGEDTFVTLLKGREAAEWASGLRSSCLKHEDRDCIFHMTKASTVKKARVMKAIQAVIAEELPQEFYDELSEFCFGKLLA